MNREDWKWVIGILIGLFIGITTTYTTLKTDDAVLNTRVAQVESSCKQHQSDINILRVEVSKVGTEIKKTDESYIALRKTLQEVAKSNKDIAIALARLEERQAKTDTVLEKLSEKIIDR